MPNFDLEFEVFCLGCGEGLCNQSETGTTRGRSMPFVRVEPCKKCMDKEYGRGVDDGYSDGKNVGHSEGYDEGLAEGKSEGMTLEEATK